MILCRSFTILFAICALGLSVAALFVKIYDAEPSEVARVALNNNDNDDDDNNNNNNVPRQAEITLWVMRRFYRDSGANEVIGLSTDYFTCDNGKIRIQVVEGLAIVAVVLALANFIMSVFVFCAGAILRAPLALYFVLSAGCSIAVFALLLDWWHIGSTPTDIDVLNINNNNNNNNNNTAGWCPEQPYLKSDGLLEWKLSLGWIFTVAASACSLLGFITSLLPC